MELPDLPDGWALKSLIDITDGDIPQWSVQARSINGEYTHGIGTTPRYAILQLNQKIEDGDCYAPLSGGLRMSEAIDILAALGLSQPVRREPLKR